MGRVVLGAVLMALAQDPESVALRFAWPSGSFLEESVTSVEVEFSKGRIRRDLSRKRSRVTVRVAGERFRIETTPLVMETERNGEPFRNALDEVFLGRTITWTVDSSGALLDVQGYEALREGREAPSDDVTAALAALDPALLAARDRTEWSGRIGRFAGEALRVGELIETVDELELPGHGRVVVRMLTEVADPRRESERAVVEIRFAFDIDPERLAPVLRGESTINDLPRRTELDLGQAAYRGGGTIVLAAETMEIQSEGRWREVSIAVDVPGHGVVHTIRREDVRVTISKDSE